SSKSYVMVQGFTVTHAEDEGILFSSCSNSTISGNHVPLARYHGIHVAGGSSDVIASNVVWLTGDHGIYLTGAVASSTVRDNESYSNARPEVRAANGIYLSGCSGERVERNRLHDNQDTGLQINASSNNNIC